MRKILAGGSRRKDQDIGLRSTQVIRLACLEDPSSQPVVHTEPEEDCHPTPAPAPLRAQLRAMTTNMDPTEQPLNKSTRMLSMMTTLRLSPTEDSSFQEDAIIFPEAQLLHPPSQLMPKCTKSIPRPG